METDYDVVIIGGGLVGLSLACALGRLNLNVAVIDAAKNRETDQRSLVLSLASQSVLEDIGVWNHLQEYTLPIRHIHISDQGHFGAVRLSASDIRQRQLAYAINASVLQNQLRSHVRHFSSVKLMFGTVCSGFRYAGDSIQLEYAVNQTCSTKLLIGADGRNSKIRELAGIKVKIINRHQVAIVMQIQTERPMNATAYERFTPHGPIALIPRATHEATLIFTVRDSDRAMYMSLSQTQLARHIEQEFSRRLGHIKIASACYTYPINLVRASTLADRRLLLIGDAAYTVHPNAAQGFNLSMRDISGLAESMRFTRSGRTIDAEETLTAYLKLRSADQKRVLEFTDRLGRLFYNRSAFFGLGRHIAMGLLDSLPQLKSYFIRFAIGWHGLQPEAVSDRSA